MYFVWNQLGAFIFLAGILVAYSATGSFEVSSLSTPTDGLRLAILGLLPDHARVVRQDGGLRRAHVAPHRGGRTPVLVRPDNGDDRGRGELRGGTAPRPGHADRLQTVLGPAHDRGARHDDLRRGDDPGPGRRQVPLRVVDDEPERVLAPGDRQPQPSLGSRAASSTSSATSSARCILFCVAGILLSRTGARGHAADGRAGGEDAPDRHALPDRRDDPLGGAPHRRVPGRMDHLRGGLLPGGRPAPRSTSSSRSSGIIATILTVAYTFWPVRKIFFGPLPAHLAERHGGAADDDRAALGPRGLSILHRDLS